MSKTKISTSHAKISKALVHIGVGDASSQKDQLNLLIDHLTKITGQKPVVRRAKKAIAGFKIRKGDPVGLLVTLRGRRMHAFLGKLIHVVLPQMHDFQGIARKSFDGKGAVGIGIPEYTVFPELREVTSLYGLGITICANAHTPSEATRILEDYGIPFERSKE